MTPGAARAPRIARATEADVDALLALDVRLVEPERQAEIVRESVAARGCLAAWNDARLAGYVTWDRGFFHRPFVRLLVVAKPFRRLGIGDALVRAVEVEARRCDLRELFVSTEATNGPMQALLARAGYRPSGSIDNLNEPGNAELVYHKRLP